MSDIESYKLKIKFMMNYLIAQAEANGEIQLYIARDRIEYISLMERLKNKQKVYEKELERIKQLYLGKETLTIKVSIKCIEAKIKAYNDAIKNVKDIYGWDIDG